MTHHIVHSDLFQLVTDVLLEEVIGSPSVNVHVPAHGHKLWSRQVVERDVVVEELGDPNDIRMRRSLTGGSDLICQLI